MIPATKKKLDEARFFFGCLEKEGRPLGPSDHFDYYVSAFLFVPRRGQQSLPRAARRHARRFVS